MKPASPQPTSPQMNLTLHVHRPRYDPVGAVPSPPSPPPLPRTTGVRRPLDATDIINQAKRQQPPAGVAGSGGETRTPEWLSRPAPTVDMPPLFAQELEASLSKKNRAAQMAAQSLEKAVLTARGRAAPTQQPPRAATPAAPSSKLLEAARTLSGTGQKSQHHHHQSAGASSPDFVSGGSSQASGSQQSNQAAFGASAEHLIAVDTLLRDLLKQLTQKPEEHQARLAAMTHIEQIARSCGLHVGVYGSSRTGVALPDSDLDLCIAKVLPDTNDTTQLRAAASPPPGPRRNGFSNPDFVTMLRAVRRSRQIVDVLAIAHARVPIIKCHFTTSTVDVDISFTTDGIVTSHYLQTQFAKPEFILARPLIMLVKLLLRSWNLHDPKDGGVGSFVVSLMMLWYLTVVDRGHWTLPDDHPHSPTTAARRGVDHRSGSTSAAAGRAVGVNEHLANEPGKAASLLIGFLQYYGTQFSYRTTGVDLTQLASFEKTDSDGLHFVNPIAPSQNAASAATLFGTSVRHRFAETARVLAGKPSKKNAKAVGPYEAVSATFARGEDAEALWERWTTVEYNAFKQRAAQADKKNAEAAAAAAAATANGACDDDYDVYLSHPNNNSSGANASAQVHKAGAFFRSVIINSPASIPQTPSATVPQFAELPPTTSKAKRKTKQRQQMAMDDDETSSGDAPSFF